MNEFKQYCSPRKNRAYERFTFNNRNQGVDDLLLSNLKKIIHFCQYNQQEDRIILGTSDPKVQEKLLNIQDVTLEKAAEVCRNSEATKKHLETFRNKDEVATDAIKKKYLSSGIL
ncbi:hypothetical protein JTB14_024188 [Gonioctena quinquepunctata]|nr:hypothetical protein JTB14_024188 [Gonioctena quinquepunctata]